MALEPDGERLVTTGVSLPRQDEIACDAEQPGPGLTWVFGQVGASSPSDCEGVSCDTLGDGQLHATSRAPGRIHLRRSGDALEVHRIGTHTSTCCGRGCCFGQPLSAHPNIGADRSVTTASGHDRNVTTTGVGVMYDLGLLARLDRDSRGETSPPAVGQSEPRDP